MSSYPAAQGETMRECLSHRSGRIFLAIVGVTLAGVMAAPLIFRDAGPLFGVVPVPFAAGFAVVIVLLPAYLVYFKRYWPFR